MLRAAHGCQRPSNLVEKIDRLGLKTTYEYDALNRRVSETWYDTGYPARIFAYQYDLLSRLIADSLRPVCRATVRLVAAD